MHKNLEKTNVAQKKKEKKTNLLFTFIVFIFLVYIFL